MPQTALSSMLRMKRLKEKLASAEKSASIWKQRYEELNEKYKELKQKAQPFLDALEIASEKVQGFSFNAILARGKETQEHKALPASVDRIWKYKKGIICAYDESEPAGNDPAYRP
jgi:chromosome segregation ATPase